MPKTIITLLVIALVWIGYIVWPLYELALMVRAIDERDLPTVTRHVNFDRVRVSLTEQVVAAYMRRSGIKPNLLAQQAFAAGVLPVVDKLVSPEALSDLLAVGWPVAVAPNPPLGTLGINQKTLGTAWQIFGASNYGIGRFGVSAPMELPPSNRFGLTFQLLQWRWQLTRVILPEGIQNLLADELIKATKRGQVSPRGLEPFEILRISPGG
jgi:hypothetical protein